MCLGPSLIRIEKTLLLSIERPYESITNAPWHEHFRAVDYSSMRHETRTQQTELSCHHTALGDCVIEQHDVSVRIVRIPMNTRHPNQTLYLQFVSHALHAFAN